MRDLDWPLRQADGRVGALGREHHSACYSYWKRLCPQNALEMIITKGCAALKELLRFMT